MDQSSTEASVKKAQVTTKLDASRSVEASETLASTASKAATIAIEGSRVSPTLQAETDRYRLARPILKI